MVVQVNSRTLCFHWFQFGSVVVPIVSSGVYAKFVNGSSVVPNRIGASITLEQRESN